MMRNMIRTLALPAAVALLPGVFAFSQEKCDESTIKKHSEDPVVQIASDDVYFNMSALRPPVVGRAQLEELRKLHAAERKNQLPTRFQIDRIVPADTGDMAYDYGSGLVEFDAVPTGKHVSYRFSYVRVWKIVAGECRMAASFSRPDELTYPPK